jgi:peptide-methionine (S)-S-oxide reductase
VSTQLHVILAVVAGALAVGVFAAARQRGTVVAAPAADPSTQGDPLQTAAALDTATFAGGCFWCMEPPYDKLDGVVATISGYTGGHKENPTYKEVSSGGTGHTEAVQITYDPSRVTYETLLDVFWRNIDPLDPRGQFCDKGSQYRSAIFYHDDAQKEAAEASKRAIEASGRFQQPIVTEIVPAGRFYRAEEYHQDYYKKNPIRYKFYRTSCGRDGRLKELWGDAG